MEAPPACPPRVEAGLQPAEPTPRHLPCPPRGTGSECSPPISQAFGVASDSKSHSNWFSKMGTLPAHGTAHPGAALTPTGTPTLSLACSPRSGRTQPRRGPVSNGKRGTASPPGSRRRPVAVRPSRCRLGAPGGCGHRPSVRPETPVGRRAGQFPKGQSEHRSQRWWVFAGSQQQVTPHPCLLVFTVKVKACKAQGHGGHGVPSTRRQWPVGGGPGPRVEPTLPLTLHIFQALHPALCPLTHSGAPREPVRSGRGAHQVRPGRVSGAWGQAWEEACFPWC